MVRKIGIHENNKVPFGMFYAMYVSSTCKYVVEEEGGGGEEGGGKLGVRKSGEEGGREREKGRQSVCLPRPSLASRGRKTILSSP